MVLLFPLPSRLRRQRCRDRRLQSLQAGSEVRAEMSAPSAALALEQDLKITSSLGRLDQTETILLSRHRQIDGVIAGDLQAHAGHDFAS
jgi:hypothetical protein